METSTVKNYNIFILGIAFMFVFTGFNTMSGIQVTNNVSASLLTNYFQAMIFKSATDKNSGGYVDGFHGDGFIR